MTKRLIPLLVLICLLGSCAPAPASPTPPPTDTVTATASLSPTPTLEPSPIPETAEQAMARIASEAISLGWNVHDETTWTGGSVELQNMKAIDADPNTKTDHELTNLSRFMIEMRYANFDSLLSADTVPETLRQAFALYASLGLPGAPTAEAFAAMKPEALRDFVHALSPEQFSLLEEARCRAKGEAFKLTPEEQITWLTGKNVIVSENLNNLALIIGSGPYGMWWNNAFNPGFGQDPTFNTPYLAPILGRTTYNGKELTRVGNWNSDSHQGLGAVTLRLPYGKPGVDVWIPNHDKSYIQHLLVEVAFADDPAVISTYPDWTGGWSKNEFDMIPPTVSLTTRYAFNRDNWNEDFHPLTMEKLLEMLGGEFRSIKINTPSEFAQDNQDRVKAQSMFFGINGIQVVGGTDRTNQNSSSGVLVFYGPE